MRPVNWDSAHTLQVLLGHGDLAAEAGVHTDVLQLFTGLSIGM